MWEHLDLINVPESGGSAADRTKLGRVGSRPPTCKPHHGPSWQAGWWLLGPLCFGSSTWDHDSWADRWWCQLASVFCFGGACVHSTSGQGPCFRPRAGCLGLCWRCVVVMSRSWPEGGFACICQSILFPFLRGDLSKLKDDRETRRFIRGIARRGCQIRGGVAAAQWPQSKS